MLIGLTQPAFRAAGCNDESATSEDAMKFRFIELFALQKKHVIPRSAATWESPAEQ